MKENLIRVIRKTDELFEVTIDNKLFATFRGITAKAEATACADKLTD